MEASAPDPTRFFYRFMLGLGAVGAAILILGLVQFLGFEPVGQHTGIRATITAIYAYDANGNLAGSQDRHQFKPLEDPAAAVDWGSLPPGLVVSGAWFHGAFAEPYGSVGPLPASQLQGSDPVRIDRRGQKTLPSGDYTFVIERYSGSQPVEILARRTVVVSGA